jgi:hypothetical protein
MKALTVGTILVLLMSAGVQTTLYIQFAFAADSNGIISANNNVVQPGYLLTVYVPSHPFGTSTVGISITTEDGYTDQANIPTAGNPSWTFNIPPNQGESVQVCVNSGAISEENCHIYKTTGSAMSVSLPAISGSISNNSSGSESSNSKSNDNISKSHNHDSSTNTNNKSNNHSDHHNSNTDNSNDNGGGSGNGFNENQRNSFNGISSAGSNAHQGNNHHGFGGSGNDSLGSNSHRNSNSDTNNNNNPEVPMVQFIGPIQ